MSVHGRENHMSVHGRAAALINAQYSSCGCLHVTGKESIHQHAIPSGEGVREPQHLTEEQGTGGGLWGKESQFSLWV